MPTENGSIPPNAEYTEEQDERVGEVTISGVGGGHNKLLINMEVPLFCLFFAISLTAAVVNNILLERTCRITLGYNETVCAQLQHSSADKELETRVQAATTPILTGQAVLEGFFPAILSLFLGVWSNTHGRKPLCTWPLFGYALTTVLITAYSLLDWLSPPWFILTSLPWSLGGGGSALFTGAYCHMSDITTNENRSFRLSILETSVFVGTILGSLASPYVLAAVGAPVLLLSGSFLAVTAYVYANLCVQESVQEALPGGLSSLLEISLVKDMVKTCFKKRPNFDRGAIFLLIVSNSLSIFALYGLFNIDYLYVREKLSWDLKDYNIYVAANTSILVVGTLLGVGLLQRKCKISDGIMTMVSIVSSISEVVCKALAAVATSWLMYFGCSISLLRGLSSPLIRSLLSKRVSTQDVAKVFALMSSLEAILPVFSPLVYNTLYRLTLKTMPQAVYLLTAALYGVCLSMVGVAHYFIVKYPMQIYSVLES